MRGHRSLMVIVVLTLVTLQIQRAFADETSYFSGKTTPFTDTYNGWKVAVPAELTLQGKGSSTHFEGPNLNGGAVSIHVNATLMKGVPSVTMFQVNMKSKKDDRNYTNVVALPTVKFGRKPVYAFRCSEADHKPGMADAKDPGDIHRWHLYVFGNDSQYIVTLAGTYAAFTEKKVQVAFNNVIKSFALVPIAH